MQTANEFKRSLEPIDRDVSASNKTVPTRRAYYDAAPQPDTGRLILRYGDGPRRVVDRKIYEHNVN